MVEEDKFDHSFPDVALILVMCQLKCTISPILVQILY